MLSGNWGPELIGLAGGVQPLTAAGVHSSYVDWPRVRAADPQVIVLCPCGFDAPRAADEGRALASLPGWDALAAVRSGRVLAVDGNAYFNRPGPRLVDTLELLAHVIWPAWCPPPPAPPGAWQRVAAAVAGC
jgi:iron complex transport system substrate-binding protein